MRKMNRDELIKRILGCILGNLLISLGVTFAKVADLGIDPFNGMCMSVSAFIGIPYTVYTWIFNLVCFAMEFIWGRKYIHIGTFLNWFMVSFVIDFFLKLQGWLGIPSPVQLLPRFLTLGIGLLVTSLGLAIYQRADLGIAPYDVLPIMYCDYHPKFPYFWARVIVDVLCVGGMLLTRSTLIGIGTLLIALGLGPIIHLFTRLLEKLFPEPQPRTQE